MSNTRRRLLSLLGLAGVPAALWSATARAQTTSVEVVCKTDFLNEPDIYHSYYRRFALQDGKLTPQPFADYTYAVAKPTTVQLTDGFSDAAVPPATPPGLDDNQIDSDAIQFKVWNPASDGFSCNFHASIRVPGEIAQCGVVLVTTAGQLAATGGGFPVSETDPNVRVIDASWDHPPIQVLQGPIQIGIYFNNAVNAIFDFDLASRKVFEQAKAMDDNLQSKTGLTIDPATNVVTGAEVCHYTPPGNSSYSGAAPCFFTTATVETLGLSDDCWELRTLRGFRDGPLARTAEGRALTLRYYAEAPRLVAAVNARGDGARIWLGAYWTHILPCALLARLGLNRLAVTHYRRLFEKLASI